MRPLDRQRPPVLAACEAAVAEFETTMLNARLHRVPGPAAGAERSGGAASEDDGPDVRQR